MKKKIKDVAIRAAKTFWQAAGGYIVAMLATINLADGDARKVITALLTPAIACGLSAVWNGVVSPLLGGEKHE